jgi:hypothetical protein
MVFHRQLMERARSSGLVFFCSIGSSLLYPSPQGISLTNLPPNHIKGMQCFMYLFNFFSILFQVDSCFAASKYTTQMSLVTC